MVIAALSAYDFSITYRAGQLNADADGLSRRPRAGEQIADPVRERQKRRIASLLRNTRPSRQVDIVDAGAVVAAVLNTLSLSKGFSTKTVLSGRRVRRLVVPYSAVNRVPRYT